MSKSSQKFIARNRAPRVQIEYDVELYGAEKTIQLPFVMGVMADLSGKSEQPLPAVADRKFLEIDVDNFDDRMRAIKPRAAFTVSNTLTGEGNIAIDLSFERMEDFSPTAIARNTASLAALLEARTQLEHLRTYMDGKSGAEALIAQLIADPETMGALAAKAEVPQEGDIVLDALRDAVPEESGESGDETGAILEALVEQSPAEAVALADDRNTVLATLAAQSLGAVPEADEDSADATLASLAEMGAQDAKPEDPAAEVILDTQQIPDIDVDHGVEDAPLEALPDGAETLADDLALQAQEATEEMDLDFDLTEAEAEAEEATPEPSAHGKLDLPKPEDRDAKRPKFRIAILGDFTGRAASGTLETGADLAARKPIRFDVDALDDVIARFATTLVLPVGTDGAGVEVALSSLDDLHPDELFENVPVFEALSDLRASIASGRGTQDIARMQEWATLFGDLKPAARSRAKGAEVPADLKLSAFQSLIGDTAGSLSTATPAEELIGRIVAPHVQAAPDPEQPAMLAAVDAALSSAMRAILHHPDFQAVESTWRSLELLARRIRTGPGLEIVLYDVSAEEWAADLAGHEDLAESGLFQMLAEEPRLDEAQGALSAVFGLYRLEETPPHADLMARMAKISDWMNAPFLTSISDGFLDTPKHERHPLVAKAWDALRALPEACYVGLAAPRFLLRLPYGARTEPVDPFEFEEFTLRDGLKGMLWANPVVLTAILMCETVNKGGQAMKLGDVMSLGDLPMHYITDPHGDQVALPCTGRMLNTRTMAEVVSRGYIPLLSIKGRNEVRQGAFQGLGAGLLAGPWGQSAGAGPALGGTNSSLDVTREAGEGPAQYDEMAPSRPGGAGEDYDEQFAPDEDEDGDDPFGDDSDDDLDLDLDGDDDDDLGGGEDAGNDTDLDDLLAGFGDDSDGGDDDAELDPELAALMADM